MKVEFGRIEQFIEWYSESLRNWDADPAIWQINYLNKRYEHNTEEKLWLSWLYGNTYQLPSAWVIKNEFPDYELVGHDRLREWNTKNYKRLRYQTDTKYNKGHLPVMFASYENFIGKKEQDAVLRSYFGDNEKQSFLNLWDAINKNYYKFGRYTTWFYMQTLAMTCGFPIEAPSLYFNDFSGSTAHRNGMLRACGWDSKIDEKLDKIEYETLELIAADIISEVNKRSPELRSQNNLFMMESCLCSFGKLFRNYKFRWIGYYLARQREEIRIAETDNWTGIEWNVLWDSRKETIDSSLLNHKSTDIATNEYLFTKKIPYWRDNKPLDALFI